MAGFTTREQYQMSRLVLGQMGNLKKLNGIMTSLDAVKAVLALRLAVVFQHAKVNFKRDKLKVVVSDHIEIALPKEWLDRYETLLFWLEHECEFWNGIGMSLSVKPM